MRIKINEKEIVLNNREVKSAKYILSQFLNKIQDEARRNEQPTYYFTMLIVMQLMSQELIDEIDPEHLEYIMNSISKIKEQ